MNDPYYQERIAQYLSLSPGNGKIKRFMGNGTDGGVWESSRDTAIKALIRENGYFNERDSYLRLAEYGVTEALDGFWIPAMVGYSDELMVVEMDMMHCAPYIIDFAKVRIDRPPEFSVETLRDQHKQLCAWFGDKVGRVESLMASLASFGIYYLDPRPGNICFDDETI